MSIRNQIGPYISACSDIIDKLTREAAPDTSTSKRLKAAFKEIRDNFLKDPDHFKFAASIEKSLTKCSPHVYEELSELVEILQGKSIMFPFPALKTDGAGEAPEAVSLKEQLALRLEICAGVTIKINTVITELSRKRKDLTQEASEVFQDREVRKAARPGFEARIAAVRARQELRSTKAGCIQLVTENGLELENLDPVFQNDKDVVLAAVKQNGEAVKFAHPRLKNDNDIAKEVLKHPNADHLIELLGEAFRENREQLLEAIRNNEMAIGYGNDELVEDRAFILEAIDANPMVLQLLDESLRNDREILIRALKRIHRNDGEFFLQIIGIAGNAIRPFAEAYYRVLRYPMDLEHLDESLRNDREIVLEAVRLNGAALQFASEALRNDREFFLDAINRNVIQSILNDHNPLQYASDALRNDEDIVLQTIRLNGATIQFASDALRNNRRFIIRALCIGGLQSIGPYIGNELLPFARDLIIQSNEVASGERDINSC